MRFLDTNVLLRHLLNDDPKRSLDCFRVVEDMEQNKLVVWTSDLVIAELVFVLSSKKSYNLSREAIRDLVLPLIELPGLKLAHKRVYRRVFDIYCSLPVDYVDAYHAALMESSKQPEIYSYDTHFDRIPGVQRFEP